MIPDEEERRRRPRLGKGIHRCLRDEGRLLDGHQRSRRTGHETGIDDAGISGWVASWTGEPERTAR